MPFTEIEELVLETIRLEEPGPFFLKRKALDIAACYGWSMPTEQELQQTIEALYQRGILQIMDAAFIEQKQAELKREQIYGPVFDWPAIGSFDLSPAGYECVREQRQQLRKNRPPYLFDVAATHEEEHSQYFALSRRVLDQWQQELEGTPGICVPRAAEACGAWQLSPQETQCTGLRLDLIQSKAFWNCKRYISYPSMDELSAAIQARYLIHHQTLQQKFGIESVVEILLLAINSGQFGQRAMADPRRDIEVLLEEYPLELPVSAEELIARLINAGWLSDVTPDSIAFYQEAQSDPAHCISLMEIPRQFEKRKCLTAHGFSVLFEMLNLLWGNQGWKNYLLAQRTVSDLYFHYYDDYERAVQDIEMQSLKSETITAGPIEELGRWCTHWYEVWEQGYRVAFRTFYE